VYARGERPEPHAGGRVLVVHVDGKVLDCWLPGILEGRDSGKRCARVPRIEAGGRRGQPQPCGRDGGSVCHCGQGDEGEDNDPRVAGHVANLR